MLVLPSSSIFSECSFIPPFIACFVFAKIQFGSAGVLKIVILRIHFIQPVYESETKTRSFGGRIICFKPNNLIITKNDFESKRSIKEEGRILSLPKALRFSNRHADYI